MRKAKAQPSMIFSWKPRSRNAHADHPFRGNYFLALLRLRNRSAALAMAAPATAIQGVSLARSVINAVKIWRRLEDGLGGRVLITVSAHISGGNRKIAPATTSLQASPR